MKLFSCCRSSPVIELGERKELRPEAMHWKLVLSQRLEHFFTESCIPLPSYVKTALERINKTVVEELNAQNRATIYQRDFQSSIFKFYRQNHRPSINGIKSVSVDLQDNYLANAISPQITSNVDFIQEDVSEYAIAVYELIQIQLGNEQHPLVEISQILTKQFVSHYSQYTGIGVATKLTNDQKKEMFRKLINDSKELNQQAQSGCTSVGLNQTHDDEVDDSGKRSVSALAADELYIILKTVCLLVETFFKPLLPERTEFNNTIQSLHEDVLKLCQRLMFQQNDLSRSVLILVRVDSQLDDKDIRHKSRQLATFTTKDFGLGEKLQLNGNQQKKQFLIQELTAIQEQDEDDLNETLRQKVTISQSIISETTFDEENKEENSEFITPGQSVDEINTQLLNPPYSQSIKKIREALTGKFLSPVEKLIQIKDILWLIRSEIQEYWELQTPDSEFTIELDRSDLLSILIYVIVKANIDDLRAQFVLLQSFTSNAIQNGFSRMSAAFSDFQNAVNFITFIDKNLIQKEGAQYLQSVSMDKLKTMMYEYPDQSDNTSNNTGYDIFGGGVRSRGDISKDNSNSSFMSIRQINAASNRPSFEKQREANVSQASNRKLFIEVNSQNRPRANSRFNIQSDLRKKKHFSYSLQEDEESKRRNSFELL